MASNVEQDAALALLQLGSIGGPVGQEESGAPGTSRQDTMEQSSSQRMVLNSVLKRCQKLVKMLYIKLAVFVHFNENKTSHIEQDVTEHRIEEINNGFKESGSEEENSGEQPRASVEAGPSQIHETPAQSTDNDDMIPIGKGHAKVPSKVLTSIKWISYTKVTRTLLEAIFPRRVLATHSLSGKQSPAFMDRPAKKILNPKLVDDIVNTVSTKCVVSKNLVRKCITVKCADEAKTCRQQKRALNDKIPL
ncbi:hypothetical protein PYW07_005256 [Mythimna separata]|uniref:BEN domain-containing protein n=1 Tax=Mythimna separata TaxID=271217 RepID=A0AAD7YE17_MYTSE|nr:hypothetical protein PYW07_005256 [Mythimna separata]